MQEQGYKPLFPKTEDSIPVSADVKYQASGDYILRTIADEHVLVSIGENEHFGNGMLTLNETYVFLWQLYQEPRTLSEVLELTQEEYEDPEGIMEQSIMSFLWQGVQFGLLMEA